MSIIDALKEVFNLYRNFNKKIEEEEMKENIAMFINQLVRFFGHIHCAFDIQINDSVY